jgi:Fe-S-cluster-containing dehydrogenase component
MKKRVIKCDFCDGDPMCVKACSTDALLFVDAAEADLVKKAEVAEKLSEDAKRFT